MCIQVNFNEKSPPYLTALNKGLLCRKPPCKHETLDYLCNRCRLYPLRKWGMEKLELDMVSPSCHQKTGQLLKTEWWKVSTARGPLRPFNGTPPLVQICPGTSRLGWGICRKADGLFFKLNVQRRREKVCLPFYTVCLSKKKVSPGTTDASALLKKVPAAYRPHAQRAQTIYMSSNRDLPLHILVGSEETRWGGVAYESGQDCIIISIPHLALLGLSCCCFEACLKWKFTAFSMVQASRSKSCYLATFSRPTMVRIS